MNILRILTLLSSIIFLQGCETWQVITFSPHPLSHQNSDKVELAVQGPNQLDNACVKSRQRLLPVVGALVIGTAIDTAMTAGGNALSSYLDKKKKEFTSEFSAQIVVPEFFDISAGNRKLAFNCLIIQQIMKSKDNSAVQSAGFVFVGEIQNSPDFRAARIIPLVYRINEGSAKTDMTGKFTLDLRYQIKSILSDDKGMPSEKIIADQTIHFPSLALPGDPAAALPEEPITPGWFALPNVKVGDGSQTTVVVDVTENGTGSPDYATAKSEISDGIKNVNADLNKIISTYAKK